MGLKSGEFAGHANNYTPSISKTIYVLVAVCGGAPSCWKIKVDSLPLNNFLMAGSNFSYKSLVYSTAVTPFPFLSGCSNLYPVVPETKNRSVLP